MPAIGVFHWRCRIPNCDPAKVQRSHVIVPGHCSIITYNDLGSIQSHFVHSISNSTVDHLNI